MGKRVIVATADLTFRAKLQAIVEAAGGEVVGTDTAAAELAVVEVGGGGWEARVQGLLGRGLPVLAFGPHVGADVLRAARGLGALAVPNSEVEERLRDLL